MGKRTRPALLNAEEFILSKFPEGWDESITWTRLWKEVSKKRRPRPHAKGIQRIGSKETLLNYLRIMLRDGLIIRETEGYRMTDTVERWRARQRDTPLIWQGKGVDDLQGFLTHLEMQLRYILMPYLEMLEGLVEMKTEDHAVEYASSYFRVVSMEAQLAIFAIEVWKKRAKTRALLDQIRTAGGLSPKLMLGIEPGREEPYSYKDLEGVA